MLTECTVTAKGSAWKSVKCSHCPCEYVYLCERTAKGTGVGVLCIGGEETARTEAQERLAQRLEDAADPVHCPQCGHYQPDMIPLYKKAKAYRIRRYFWWALIPCFLTFVLMPLWVLGIILVRPIVSMTTDPNKDAAARAGQQVRSSHGPFVREQFENMVRQAQAQRMAETQDVELPELVVSG